MSRHVLFVHDNRSVGGVGAVSAQLAAGLEEHGWSVDHLFLASPLAVFKAMSRLVRERGLVLATQNFSASYVAMAIAAICGRPWVMAVHGPVTRVLEAAPPSPSKRRWLRWVYSRAPVIACSSQASLDSLREFCPPGTGQIVQVIRNTASSRFHDGLAATNRPPNRIGFVGRLSAEKQPMLLVEVLRELPAEWQLDVVGTGPLLGALERAAHEEISAGRIHMRGLQPVTPETYRRWTATVLCSSYEGYPLVLLESLASGVPVVSTPIAPALEMLGEKAPSMLAKDAAPASIAKAVLALAASDPGAIDREIAAVNRAHDPAAFVAEWDSLLTRTSSR